ncbi:MAG: hypothetical protein U5P10_05695 [Spirochaetia bacterium]|nr:hypothetical protein [Spirochaetia bacterium]
MIFSTKLRRIASLAVVCGVLLTVLAFAENGAAEEVAEAPQELDLVMEGEGYRISSEREYHIDGVTQKYILDNYLEFDEKRIFANRVELELYLQEKEQEILNQRIFHSGRIEYEIKPRSGEPDAVVLDVYVQDTMNMVVLPYFKYDSNDGLLLSLRGRHYNFLGSMQPLAANLDYWYTEDREHELSLNSHFSMPFRKWGHDWVFDVSEDVVYTPDEPLDLNLGTDLSVYLPFWDIRWKLKYNQDFYLNDDGADDADGYYLKSGLSFGGSIPTGISIDGHEMKYSPSISSSIAYKLNELVSAGRRGPDSTFKHGLSFGRVDWIRNYRRGYKFSISNSNAYNFYEDDWDFSINSELQGHLAGKWMGLSSRLKGFYLIDHTNSNVGGPIRGVLDHRIDDVEAGATLNVDVPFPMWIWFMSRWFEAQISPFFDAGYFLYRGEDEDWNPLWYGAGIEGFAYLKRSRSVYLRVSLGVDMQAMLEGGGLLDEASRDGSSRLELYIGLGHHY